MPENRAKLSDRNDRTRGTVQVYREGPGKFVVERSDIDGVYERLEGFRTYRQAIEEAKCYWG